MDLAELIKRRPDSATLQLWLSKVPYATYLGIEAEVDESVIRFRLPAAPHLIGNPVLPAIHGGVVGAFMEQAGAFHLLARMAEPVLPKTINFSLDYVRAARDQDTYAECTVTRQGKHIANVAIVAWQVDRQEPTATARAHFLVSQG